MKIGSNLAATLATALYRFFKKCDKPSALPVETSGAISSDPSNVVIRNNAHVNVNEVVAFSARISLEEAPPSYEDSQHLNIKGYARNNDKG